MEEDYKTIENICNKKRNDIDFYDVLIAINNTITPPQSFHFYVNLCTHDAVGKWNLEEKMLLKQSRECVEFIVTAFK